MSVMMVLNRIQRAKFGNIFANYLKIRPIRPRKITDCTTPHGDLLFDTLFVKIHRGF